MAKPKPNRKSVAEELSAKIIEQLKADTAPWQNPWEAGEIHWPFNGSSGTVYKGINMVNLASQGYADPRWMTFKQANEEGFRVRKGSRAQPVVFWQWTDRQTVKDDNGRPVLDQDGQQVKATVKLDRPRIYLYSIFHASQLQTENGQEIPPYEKKEPDWNPHDRAEAILKGSGAELRHDQRDRAFYRCGEDAIHLPPREIFPNAGQYYATALHELAHWTARETRLNRENGPFGSESYAREELRAEITSWMVAQELGLPFDPGQHTAYVGFWIKALEEDPYEITRACWDAEQIKDYVLGLERGRPLEQDQSQKTGVTFEFAEVDMAKFDSWSARESAEPDRQTPAVESLQDNRAKAAEKVYLRVPYREKNQAREAGAKWDKDAKLWYAPAGTDLVKLSVWLPPKELAPAQGETLKPQEEFGQTLAAAGFKLDGPPAMDSQIHRVPVEGGRTGNKDGAYCGHLDGRPNGWLQNHRTGEQAKWIATGQVLTEERKAALKAEAAQRLTEREKERGKGYERAIARIFEKLTASKSPAEVGDHPYLKAKGVKNYGLSQDKNGNLLLPGINLKKSIFPRLTSPLSTKSAAELAPELRLQTLQTIDREGRKYLEPGSQKAKAMFLIGQDKFQAMAFDDQKLVLAKEPVPEILIAEGYATGASLHMATGKPVAVAFDAGNLLLVAQALKEKFPRARLTFCADNDHQAKINVGLEKAQAAAQAIGGKIVMPIFTREELAKGLTDFNDLHQSRGDEKGLKAVADCLKIELGRSAWPAVQPAKAAGVSR